jgi:hypothetical protein
MAYILYIIMNFKDFGKLAERFLKRCTGLNGEPVGYAGSTNTPMQGIVGARSQMRNLRLGTSQRPAVRAPTLP